MSSITPDFSKDTKILLSKMSCDICCICGELTVKPNSTYSGVINTGEAAHIRGARYGKDLRFDTDMTNEERKHISNGIWLCTNCHTKIDKDQNEYTSDKLTQIRNLHYEKIRDGVYDKSNFFKIDEYNQRIRELQSSISDKVRLISQNEIIYNHEITQLKIDVEKLRNDRDKLWDDYSSICEKIDNNKNFDILVKLVFEEGDYDEALNYLSTDKLNQNEIDLVKSYLLKADIYKLQNNIEAKNLYKKAYTIISTYTVGTFYKRYLEEIKDYNELIDLINDLLNREKSDEKILSLKGELGRIYTKTNQELAIKEYKIVLDLIEERWKNNKKYPLLKAQYLNSLAYAYKNQGNLQISLTICEQSRAILHTINDSELMQEKYKRLSSLYNLVAHIYEENTMIFKAQEYYHLAQTIYENELKDNSAEKAALLINYSQIYANTSYISDGINLINQALEILERLYNESPLQYVEIFIGALCKKSDYLLKIHKHSDSLTIINEAKKIIDIYTKLNPSGFEYLLAEIESRMFIYYTVEKNTDQTIEHLDKCILIYENSNIFNFEVAQKYAILVITKSNFITINQMKIELLQKAKSILHPFSSRFSSIGILINQVDKMILDIKASDSTIEDL